MAPEPPIRLDLDLQFRRELSALLRQLLGAHVIAQESGESNLRDLAFTEILDAVIGESGDRELRVRVATLAAAAMEWGATVAESAVWLVGRAGGDIDVRGVLRLVSMLEGQAPDE